MNRFLSNEFWDYGTDVINFTNEEITERHDPMDLVFPKVAKCDFFKYGHSGTGETKDLLCILPINVINEKIFVFIWFWLV